jgi:hypothetical protein
MPLLAQPLTDFIDNFTDSTVIIGIAGKCKNQYIQPDISQLLADNGLSGYLPGPYAHPQVKNQRPLDEHQAKTHNNGHIYYNQRHQFEFTE